MNRRGTGAVFCLISALLFIARYVGASILGFGYRIWDSVILTNYSGLAVSSVAALIIGAVYLIAAEADADREKRE